MDNEELNSNASGVARKKRRLTKFQGESSNSGCNKENNIHTPTTSFCINDGLNSIYTQTQLRDVTNLINTAPSEIHNVERQHCKRKGFPNGQDGINLTNRYTDTVTTNPEAIHVDMEPTSISFDTLSSSYQPVTLLSDHEDDNSNNANSLPNSYGSCDSFEAGELLDSHLQELIEDKRF
ncbi:hypothetical protein RYX36_009224 [Vicia faba]